MFLNSTIAKNFHCSKTKCSYFDTFGIALHVRKILKEMIKKSPFLTILFDESLNSDEQ